MTDNTELDELEQQEREYVKAYHAELKGRQRLIRVKTAALKKHSEELLTLIQNHSKDLTDYKKRYPHNVKKKLSKVINVLERDYDNHIKDYKALETQPVGRKLFETIEIIPRPNIKPKVKGKHNRPNKTTLISVGLAVGNLKKLLDKKNITTHEREIIKQMMKDINV